MEMDKEGKNIFILGSSMQNMDASSETLIQVSLRAEMKMDLAAERDYLFEHVYKQEKNRFYNVNMHGVDWDAMAAAYRKFLPVVTLGIFLCYGFVYLFKEGFNLGRQLSRFFSVLLRHTKVYLLAFDSIFVPSIYSTSRVMNPFSASMITNLIYITEHQY